MSLSPYEIFIVSTNFRKTNFGLFLYIGKTKFHFLYIHNKYFDLNMDIQNYLEVSLTIKNQFQSFLFYMYKVLLFRNGLYL